MKKNIILFISILSLFNICVGQNKTDFIQYSAPFEEIVITPTMVHHRIDKPEYDNPVSAVPSSVKSEIIKYTISIKQFKELMSWIDKSGFWTLKESYGAPAAERHYPYSLNIQSKKKSKTVLFRSNPSYESSPEQFQEIEKYLKHWLDGLNSKK